MTVVSTHSGAAYTSLDLHREVWEDTSITKPRVSAPISASPSTNRASLVHMRHDYQYGCSAPRWGIVIPLVPAGC